VTGTGQQGWEGPKAATPWWANTDARRLRLGKRWEVYIDLSDQWIGRFAPKARPERYYVFPPCVVWKHHPSALS